MGALDEAFLAKQLVADGNISPQLMQGLSDAALLQDAVGSHYELTELVNGKKADRGKIKLKARQMHGASNSPQTIDALLRAIEYEKHGDLVTPRQSTPHSRELRMAADRILAPAGASVLAGVGLRAGGVESLDGSERLLRALDRIDELDRGFNQKTGAIYDGVGLDGGHKLPHNKYPGMSEARENMMFENKYENRVKGNREGGDVVNAMTNSLMKRLRSGDVSPAMFADRYRPGRSR